MQSDTPSSPEGEKAPQALAPSPVVMKKGPWTAAEDAVLVEYVRRHGEGNWNAVQRTTGLARCGKSCRLRWTNHLRPNLKKGSFSPDEELLIARLHAELGNKWARMAAQMPGRTDNEIKNYWNTRLKRRQRAGLPIYPPEVQLQLALAKSCRYGFSSSAPSSPNMLHIPPLDVANAAAARYTNARPPPLDLAGQFAISRPVPLLSPLPFSAPTSPVPLPWAKQFTGNSLCFQFPHSSPVSPTTPTTPVLPVIPDLSLGYGMRSCDRSSLPPLSPYPALKMELPSTQLRPAMPGGGSGGGLQEQRNAARLEAMLQELHDAMEMKASAEPVTAGDREGDRSKDGSSAAACQGSVLKHDSGNGIKMKNEPTDETGLMHDNDVGTLFDLIPTSMPAPTPAASKLSDSQHSNDEERSNLDLGMDLQLLAGVSSTDQDWSLDACQWNNMSRIC